MKQTISIIVIVVALAGAGVFSYLTFFGNQKSAPPSTTNEATAPTTSEILPLGSNLNFDGVQSFNKDKRLYQYPIVNPSEIGPIMGSMVKQ